MVEFGLKLDDNKVSEWSDHYIDYEALKKLLKKAKIAEKRYHDLCEKDPNESKRITERYRIEQKEEMTTTATTATTDATKNNHTLSSLVDAEGLTGLMTTTPPLSTKVSAKVDSGGEYKNIVSAISLPALHTTRVLPEGIDDDADTEKEAAAAAAVPTERTALLEQHVGEIESPFWLSNSNDPEQQQPSLIPESKMYSSKSIKRSLSNLSDHVSRFSTISLGINQQSRYEKQIRSALKEIDDLIELFESLFRTEQKKVVTFYYEKLQELQDRLEYVKESVAQSFGILRPKTNVAAAAGGEEGMDDLVMSLRRGKIVSPFPTHRKQSSSLGQRMEEIFHRLAANTSSIGRNTHTSSSTASSGGRKYTHVGKLFQVENIHLGGVDDYEDYEDDPALDEKRFAEAESIRRALVTQYRSAILLHNYAIMNITGFVKIVKKFNKTIPEEAGRFKEALESRNMLNDGTAVDFLAAKYEQIFANWFCEGDIRAAKAQMLTKQGDGLEMDWSQLQLGYRMGMCAVLALWVCWDCVWGLVADGTSTIGARAAFPVFRACGGLLLLQWFWGCSVFIWTRYRVNYIFLFDLDPRYVSTPIGIFAQAVDNTLLYMLLMLLYYKSGAHDMPNVIPPGGYPLILVLLTILKLIFPLRQRRPMWNIIFKVATAPFHTVTFFQTYIGDIFTSLVKVFQDIAWTICWVLAGHFLVSDESDSPFRNYAHSIWYKNVLIPILTQLPLLMRFNQCLRKFHDTGERFPHLANAGKYALSQMVTLAGTFHPLYLEYTGRDQAHVIPFYQILWTVLFVSSSLYSFTWDVYMDWGLGKKEHGYLGPLLMYPRKYYYFCTIALDLVLRFMWVLTLVPPSSGAAFAVPEYLTALSMMLELFRRTVWGFFRLENEHRSNASGYRRVDFVPLHFNTGHQHLYEDKKERSGTQVLTEIIIVTVIVAFFCFASVVAAQHANRAQASLTRNEL